MNKDERLCYDKRAKLIIKREKKWGVWDNYHWKVCMWANLLVYLQLASKKLVGHLMIWVVFVSVSICICTFALPKAIINKVNQSVQTFGKT